MRRFSAIGGMSGHVGGDSLTVQAMTLETHKQRDEAHIQVLALALGVSVDDLKVQGARQDEVMRRHRADLAQAEPLPPVDLCRLVEARLCAPKPPGVRAQIRHILADGAAHSVKEIWGRSGVACDRLNAALQSMRRRGEVVCARSSTAVSVNHRSVALYYRSPVRQEHAA